MGTCGVCGGVATIHYTQACLPSLELSWGRVVNCKRCGEQVEDGRGRAPTYVREGLLSQGVWTLRVTGDVDRLSVMRTLREALSVSVTEAHRMAKSAQEGLLTGTEAEVLQLQLWLRRNHVDSWVSRS